MIEVKPQQGKQEEFLSSGADIVIYGGAAGGGKSWGLLIYPLHNCHVKGFRGTIFRRTKEQIRNTGALWDAAVEIYSLLSAKLKEQALEIFYKNMKLKFSSIEYEKDKHNWDGSEICYLAFDELQSFTETQFWYLVARARSTCGVIPYIRATCMADAFSWVKKLILWWLDSNGEYADLSKSGVIKWILRLNDEIYWADTREELIERFPDERPMSITFIPSYVYDNKILLEKDPQYLANLKALPTVERERKEKGNWKIIPTAGMYARREQFEVVDTIPAGPRAVVRAWDRAATEKTAKNDPCWTAGVKISRIDDIFYVEHVSRFQAEVFERDKMIKNMATSDGVEVIIGLEQEPGASGKAEVAGLIRFLAGFTVKAFPAREDKLTRALPFFTQVQAGNVKLVRGPWNDAYVTELENFDGGKKGKWDQVDGSSLAFSMLATAPLVLTTHTVPSPEIQEQRKVKISEDMRGQFNEGRNHLI